MAAHHHETFAYACELWACRSRQPSTERGKLDAVVQDIVLADARVSRQVLFELLRAAELDGWSALLRVTGRP